MSKSRPKVPSEPVGVWSVRKGDWSAEFKVRDGKVVVAQPPLDKHILKMELLDALAVCWDRECKTTFEREEM